MKQRIITAAILAPLVVLGIYFLPFSFFMLGMTGIILIGFWEWTQFISKTNRARNFFFLLALLALIYLFIPLDLNSLMRVDSWHFLIITLGCLWWIFASYLALTYPKTAKIWHSTPSFQYIFPLFALVPFVLSVFLLRAMNYPTDTYHGANLVMFVCFLVWSADSGAYFVGKRFGKHKMAPQVSPNKTIEGLIGGVACSMLVGYITSPLLNIQFHSISHMLVITAATVIISVLGDLIESMLKRESGIKDSSQILPGHGGVLDRIDSLIAAFPVFTCLYLMTA